MPSFGSLCSQAVRSFRNRAYSNLVVPDLSSRKFIFAKHTLCRRTSTMSTSPVNTEDYVGQSGLHYQIERVLQDETDPRRHVCLATAGDRKFILKYIHAVNFEYLKDINNRLRNNASHVRLTQDIIPDQSMFVFEYFADHLLRLSQKDLSLGTVKRILKDGLRGIAEMHDQDIVHTDIKADNFFVNWKDSQDGVMIERAHAKGPVGKPSDIFSYALVCICVLYKHVILAVGEDELDEGIHRLAIVIERQISYFADEVGLNGLFEHLGDNPWVPIFKVTWDGLNKENPRQPFALWKQIDDDFKDLICGMTNFDPKKRITAREALEHQWFQGVLR
ncbi:kinase-like protein [Aspergillus ibericus CBS 121593]|uniref:Kinase-like protein n=1 Tax=Aspergillus ibericus CBS 121593 TaxID=1448316 RepID=A0A395GX77_9EURO|nr:kinase-like protein [Aspergillus ibericus CBS 121593]RAK99287.1 kinase-like protein [Aspergillus ibericus CBS 121593]